RAAFGRELTEDVIPLEAPTENAISHVKGCYPGQEVIARLHMRGRPARHLRGLQFAATQPAPPGAVLDADGKPGAATVTASGTSPRLGPIALAYVHRDWCAAGTRLRLADGEAGEGEAVVVELPFPASVVNTKGAA
ncbi:MAG: glycine cleavage T C-terminal barrel domain-containing protein, partial [Gemmatimonadota bacterium]